MSYTIDWIGNNAIISLKGHVDFKDIDTADGMLYGDSRYEKMEFQIFDMTDVENFNISKQDMQVIGVMDKNSSLWNKKMKVALVAKNESIVKLIEVYIEVMKATEWHIKIFPELDEALKWCNISLPNNT
jgi:hypothetical protein